LVADVELIPGPMRNPGTALRCAGLL